MFRYKGRGRTFTHNLSIAILLSFVAGIVNVAGYLSVHQLTTNVTGHFAFLIEEVNQSNFTKAIFLFLYILSFLFGSFTSNFLVELNLKRNSNYVYLLPIAIECSILFGSALFGQYIINKLPNLLAFLLLFAMGLQNALVTVISKSIVRTTHLTGLFTDLGIELSQLFFYKESSQQLRLLKSIRLRMAIISSFFIGGIAGGLAYSQIQLYALIIAGIVLLFGVVINYLKYRYLKLKRRYQSKKIPSNNDN